MLSSSIVSWVIDGGIALWGLIATFACSCLSAISRSYREDSAFNWLRKLVDVFALNIFHAEPAGSARHERVREGDLGLLKKVNNDFRTVRDLYEKEKEKVINALSVKEQLQKLVEDKDKAVHRLSGELDKAKDDIALLEAKLASKADGQAIIERTVKTLKSHRTQLLKSIPDQAVRDRLAEKYGMKVRKVKPKTKLKDLAEAAQEPLQSKPRDPTLALSQEQVDRWEHPDSEERARQLAEAKKQARDPELQEAIQRHFPNSVAAQKARKGAGPGADGLK